MSIYDYSVKTIDGGETTLAPYRGKVMLIVNVASKCGFTPQYNGLEKLYEKYKDRGFVVLGFPCNQFANQEPKGEGDIKQFCETRFSVKFPLFSKVDVNGPATHPLYAHLKKEKPGLLGTERVKWNFTKFLVDSQGKVLKRYAPTTKPEQLESEISTLLQ